MNEFFNLWDDDEVEDEEEAVRVREKATTREGEEAEAAEPRDIMVIDDRGG